MPAPPDRAFFRAHLWLPLAAFALAFGALELFALDPVIARAWYFDEQAARWLGAGGGAWWARDVLHDGGRWLARGIAAAALALWALSYLLPRLREWRRPAAYAALSMVLAIAVVGLLKLVTNVDCPWDLAGFGGHNPYVPLFAHRPDALPRAQCFPGAHASSGFALMSIYFALRDRYAHAARWALGCAIVVGIAFSIGQEARGAHFLSHDLTSAALVWLIQLALYVRMRRPSSSMAPMQAPAPVRVGAEPGACSSAANPPAAA